MLYLADREFERELAKLEARMKEFAGKMEFEEAAKVRDRILNIRRERLLG